MDVIIHTEEQIAGIRRSCRLAARTLQYLGDQIAEGITTAELDNRADTYIREHGAIPASLNYCGFPKSICTSINEEVCHGIPSATRTLVPGDIISVDVATILDGYFGDCCATFPVPPVSEAATHLIAVTKECLAIGIRQVRAGNYIGNIGYHIARYAHLHGYSIVEDFVGHGLGQAYHQDPQIPHIAPKDSGLQMQAGFIYTIEPMIAQGRHEVVVDEADGWTARTVDGQLAAQFEHTVLVTPTGCEILTVCDCSFLLPKDMLSFPP